VPRPRLAAQLQRSAPPLVDARTRGVRRSGLLDGLAVLATTVAGLALVLFDLYAFRNRSGPTGLPLMDLAWCFGAVALVGAALVGGARGGWPIRPGLAWLLLGVGVAGFANVALVERCGVLLEYEEWLRRGLG
jgi:hypothetical protein